VPQKTTPPSRPVEGTAPWILRLCGRSAPAAAPLSVDLPGRLDHDVQPLSELLVTERRVEVEFRGQCFQDGADAHTLLCGESVPMIMRVIAHVGVKGFPSVVV